MAKREQNRVRKVWPLLIWRNCVRCLIQFRREYGWSVEIDRYPYTVNFCNSCAKDADQALTLSRIICRRPSAAPSAPPKKP